MLQNGLFALLAKGISFSGLTVIISIMFAFICLIAIVKVLDVNLGKITVALSLGGFKYLGVLINRQETRLQRDILIGRINEKEKKVKLYRFLNDMIIDLGLKAKGCTPYEFMWILLFSALAVSYAVSTLVFNAVYLTIFVFPIALIGIGCGLYTKANVSHDIRIEAIIESENIICNNIKDGTLVAVKNSIDLMPLEVRAEFRDFIDNVEYKNYHIKTALQELNTVLGSVADEFIKKCIVFETEEVKGLLGTFQDIVEINTIKTGIRNTMKRKFEKAMQEFALAAGGIGIFLLAGLIIFPFLREFYLHNPAGQIILLIDALLIIFQFVNVTRARAIAL